MWRKETELGCIRMLRMVRGKIMTSKYVKKQVKRSWYKVKVYRDVYVFESMKGKKRIEKGCVKREKEKVGKKRNFRVK